MNYMFVVCLTLQSLENLYSRLITRGDNIDNMNGPKRDVENDLLRVLSYQAESVSYRS